jgi:hypothetical protein
MTQKFSPGDVVVCIDNDGAPMLTLRGLYTITFYEDCPLFGPGVGVEEAEPANHRGFYADRFRKAYSPDPEVEREVVDTPVCETETA